MTKEKNIKQKQFYGRRTGRPLRKAQKDALKTLLPALDIPESTLENAAALVPSSLFADTPNNIWMEIGFGDGIHLKGIMNQNPDTAFIGVEPFVNGMASFLKSLDKTDEGRVRVYMDDAMQVVRSLSDESLERLYILNPDPWHKTRHHKRRIVNPNNLGHFARVLKPGAQMVLSTDVPYLAEWMLTHTINHPAFTWTAGSANDWKTPPKNWITTTYETKGAKGADRMCYLIFEKILANRKK